MDPSAPSGAAAYSIWARPAKIPANPLRGANRALYTAAHMRSDAPENSTNERQAALAAYAAELPTEPGVYLMRGRRGEVLYVGKAKSLRARVRTYFGASHDGRVHITYLLRKVEKVDVVVTKTEKEAVILENTLIKKYKPPYNIIFRDDKTYLHVKLSVQDEWPRIYRVRRPAKDGSRLFGPYTSGLALRETLETLQRVFPLRTCSDHELKNRTRPCIEFEIGRCLAPCVGKVTQEQYGELVRQVDLYLSGRREELMRRLKEEMVESSEKQEYELAAQMRDRLQAIERTLEKQTVVSNDDVDQDVLATQDMGSELWIQVLFVRNGNVLETHGYALAKQGFELPEILSQFLVQYYSDERHPVPQEVLVPCAIEDEDPIREVLEERRGGRVQIAQPQRGHRKALLDMARRNAQEAIAARYEASERQERVLRQLQEDLKLPRLPRRIECFDISHMQGGNTAASMVCFVSGEPEKRLYRKFEVRGINPGDDYAAMSDVIARRYRKALGGDSDEDVPEKDALPDLIMVDGGKGQLRMLEEVLKALGIGDRVDAPGRISLAKSRVQGAGNKAAEFGRSDERVFVPGRSEPIVLQQDTAPLHLLAYLRDESHRFAITYHRKLRAKAKFRSALDDVVGVGKKRRTELLKHFGSVSAVKEASLEALEAAPGMNRRVAREVWSHFHGPLPEAPAATGESTT